MKILSLRLKNLNALYGEWHIDFTDPEYQSNGIFALTGPTGAGKSTILDAICLALYGETPRLGRITQSANDIMSRQTGECFAEIMFESQAGTFLCHWEQRRARLKADGKLQAPEHAISEAYTGKLIETKKTFVLKVIEEKTGMDFDRFTRSILLAQGGFDTFLKASAEQKSKILEQITGTEIYSDISIRVHERLKDEQAQLDILKAEVNAIGLLTSDEVTAISADIQAHKAQEAQLEHEWRQIKKAIEWRENITALQAEIDNLANESNALDSELAAFAPKRMQLDLALKADSISREATALITRKNQIARLTETRMLEEKQLPTLVETTSTHQLQYQNAENETTKAKSALKTITPLINEVRNLDQTIKQTQLQMSAQADSIQQTQSKLNTQQAYAKDNLAQQNIATLTLEEIRSYLTQNANDAWLVSGLTGVEVELQQIAQQQQKLQDLRLEKNTLIANIAAFSQSSDAAKHTIADEQQALNAIEKQLISSRNALEVLLAGKFLREYRAEKESLLRALALVKTIMALEAHRNTLVDGQPCPLCGATDHPYAEGNIPPIDETQTAIHELTERIEKAEHFETTIQRLDSQFYASKQQLSNSEQSLSTIAHQQASAQENLHQLDNNLTTLSASLEVMTSALLTKLAPLGIAKNALNNSELLLKQLKDRLNTWQENTIALTTIEKNIGLLKAEQNSTQALIDTHTQRLNEQLQSNDHLTSTLRNHQQARMALFEDKDPEQEFQKLQTAIDDAEKNLLIKQSVYQTAKEAMLKTQSKIEQLQQAIATETPELKQVQFNFDAACRRLGFANDADYQSACLDRTTLSALSNAAKILDEKHNALLTKQQDRAARLMAVKQQAVTETSLEALKPQYQQLDDSLKTLRNQIATGHQKLQDNEDATARAKDKQDLIAAHERDCEQWETLHALIGSADGKKYRNFAQGLTFELMVNHANKQLAHLTDRYLLMRDTAAPLALNVIDQYQAGEIRPTKNLSGGESFIVSLSLALGLSKMASQKVRVDSLFLDEGFGTLDEDALETALESLSSLQHDGKLIGVISHVPALKERIHTQIAIQPINGGKSEISGPGCRKIK